MSKKKPLIDYTNRDYESIRKELLSHVKRYYSNTYKDFNEASFGSLMLDTVSYIGDMLSFYLDYQANESFIDTSIEYENVIRHAKSMGYKFRNNPISHGVCTFFIVVPSLVNATRPDLSYAPILEKGTLLSTTQGTTYTLAENINFSNPDNEMVVAAVDDDPSSQAPTFFAIKAAGRVVSGELAETYIDIGDFRRFRKVEIPGSNISEIVSVTDQEGNKYHEVDYLSQDTVFKEKLNKNYMADSVPSVLKPIAVLRRYIVEQSNEKTHLQFGYGSADDIHDNEVLDPAAISLKVHGKNYVSTPSFDPLRLTKTEKFGIAPSNTVLRVVYRINSQANSNAAARSIDKVSDPVLFYADRQLLKDDMVKLVSNSLEVENESAIIGDITLPQTDEIKRRAIDVYAAQHRAVTLQDYRSMVYAMPPQFGAIKRCSVERDMNDLQRNLNIYVMSEDESGNMVNTNTTIKRNLKSWINSVRMISDTIDIINAKVVNIGLVFEAMVEDYVSKEEVLNECYKKILENFTTQPPELGESFFVTDVFKTLKDVEGLIDVTDIKVVIKTGEGYNDTNLTVRERLTSDGRVFRVPKDTLWEIKNPSSDITGILK